MNRKDFRPTSNFENKLSDKDRKLIKRGNYTKIETIYYQPMKYNKSTGHYEPDTTKKRTSKTTSTRVDRVKYDKKKGKYIRY